MKKALMMLLVLGLAAGTTFGAPPSTVNLGGGLAAGLPPAATPEVERNLHSRPADGRGPVAVAAAVKSATGIDEAWVDDDFTSATNGWGVTHFATIAEAVGAINAFGTISVYPGAYDEAMPGCLLYDGTGPYTFGLFLALNGVTVQGVDAGGVPITSHGSIAATVQCNATNNFGPSGVFIEGTGVTVSGLEFFLNPQGGQNKTIEVIGDAATVRHCRLSDGNSLYISDFRFDAVGDESWVKSYTVLGNHFTNGTSFDPNSGAGYSGPVASRQVIGNLFEMAGATWNAISFSGSGTGVPWFVYGVGGAVIQGNTFTGGAVQYIRARGTYDNSQFDWDSYFTDNTFDRSVVVGANPPADLREYSYTSGSYVFNHCRRIGVTIQGEVTNGVAGDVVLAGAGNYPESLLVNKPLALHGGGVAVLDGATLSATAVGVSIKSGNVTFDGFEVANFKGNGIIVGYESSTPGGLQNIHITDNHVHHIIPGYSWGFGIYIGFESEAFDDLRLAAHLDYSGLVVSGNDIHDTACSGLTLQSITAGTGWLHVTGNNLHDIATNDGLWIDSARRIAVTGNTITNNDDGVFISRLANWGQENGPFGPKDLTFTNNTITNSTKWGITMYAGWPATMVVTGGLVSGNGTYGVRNYNMAGVIDARNVDWGHPSGPLHVPSNPGGTANKTSNGVLFTPWVGRTTTVTAITATPYGPLGLDGTMALGVDGDSAPGFAPGAFRAPGVLPTTKYGFDPELVLGRPVNVAELHSVTYFTKKGSLHTVQPADWFFQFYTDYYAGAPGSWYGHRIQAEPYFAENLTETAGAWNQWVTAAGAPNRLRFFDSSSGYFGSYTDGFLADLTANPAYAAQTIMLMYLGLGSATAAGFDGLLDGAVVELVNGQTISLNFVSGTGAAGITPATSGPVACGQAQTMTVSLTTTEGMPNVFGFNAVLRANGPVSWGTPTSLAPFGSTTQFFTVNQGDGSYVISGTTVGSPTQPITGVGTTPLFSVAFTGTGTGTANLSFDSFSLRDPSNAPIPATASGASITFDCTSPAAVAGITATPAHNKVNVAWTHNGADTSVYEVYRGLWYDGAAGVSAYPEYDDLPNDAIPARPATRAAAIASDFWELAGTRNVGTTTFADEWPNASSRGVYYYEVFVVDGVGNASVGATMTARPRATNYWLGDVHGNLPLDTVPNGVVNSWDMNALGTYYGSTVPLGGAGNSVDVGPTDNWSRVGVPLTDSAVNFEDLIVFAMNFGVVSAAKVETPPASSVDLAWVTYGDGSMALRLVDGNGLKGLRVTADADVASVTAGRLLDGQAEPTFMRNVGRSLDVGLAVLGVNTAFTGTGDLFVVAPGAAITAGQLTITARGIDNSALEVSLTSEAGGQALPRAFALYANSPNPFNPLTKIAFSLPSTEAVRLEVFGLDGRHVATLVDETRAAGLHEVLWIGTDDGGKSVASGTYFYRLDAGSFHEVRKMTLVK